MRRCGPAPRDAADRLVVPTWYATHSTNRGYARGSGYAARIITPRGLIHRLWSVELQPPHDRYRRRGRGWQKVEQIARSADAIGIGGVPPRRYTFGTLGEATPPSPD